MMEAAPSAAFVMPEAELLLEVLIVAFDTPAQLGEIDQAREADVLRQGGQPVLRRLGLALWPFHQQPLFGAYTLRIATGGAHPQAGDPGGQSAARRLAPRDAAPRRFRQAEGQRLDRDRLVAWRATWVPRSTTEPRPRRRRRHAGCPYRRARLEAGDIAQRKRADRVAQPGVVAITRVHHHDTARHLLPARRADLIERDRALGLEHDLFRNLGRSPALGVRRPALRQGQAIAAPQPPHPPPHPHP